MMFTLILIYAIALSSSGAVAVAPAAINGLVAASVVERAVVLTMELNK